MKYSRLHISSTVQTCILSVLLVSFIGGYFGYKSYSTEKIQKNSTIAKDLLSMINTAAALIDINAHEQIHNDDAENEKAKTIIIEQVAKLQDLETHKNQHSNSTQIMTLRKSSDYDTSKTLDIIIANNRNGRTNNNNETNNTAQLSPTSLSAHTLHIQAFYGHASTSDIYIKPTEHTKPEKHNAVAWITAVAPLTKNGVVVGLIQVNRPLDFYFTEITQLKQQYLAYGLLGLLVSVIFSWLYGSYITQPIRLLSQATKSINDGDYSYKITETHIGDLGPLYNSFNQMSENIEAVQKSLKLKNIELNTTNKTLAADQEECLIKNEEIIQDYEKLSMLKEELDLDLEETQKSLAVKNEFLANMAHEIKNPMNSVIGFTQLLLRSDLPPKVNKLLKRVDGSANNLMGIVNQILDLSKIESGKLELDNNDYDLYGELEKLVMMNEEKIAERNLNIVLRVPHPLPRLLYGDSVRTCQIFSNLISNAIKFTHHGHICITVEWSIIGERNVEIFATITDTGVGMSEQACENIFDPFTQANQTVSTSYGGTGLGLTIAQDIAHHMNGHINVQSTPDEGSIFSVSLVQMLSEEVDLDEVQNIRQENLSHQANPKNLRYLVIDDCALIGEQLAEWLGPNNVSYADSIQSASDLIEQSETSNRPYDAIIFDYQLDNHEVGQSQWLLKQCGIDKIQKFLMMPIGMHIDPDTQVYIIDKPLLYNSVIEALSNPDQTLDGHCQPPCTIFSSEDDIEDDDKEEVAITLNPLVGNKRVLLVEDDINNQVLAGLLLDEYGIQHAIAGNGLEAIQMLEDMEFDLVLMDVQMPKLDGFGTTKVIRENRHTQDITVIAMTANTTPEDQRKCVNAGMNGYVPKPIDSELLFGVLDQYLLDKDASIDSSDSDEITSEPQFHESSEETFEQNKETLEQSEEKMEASETLEEITNSNTEISPQSSNYTDISLPMWDRIEVLNRVRGKEISLLKFVSTFVETNPLTVDKLLLAFDVDDFEGLHFQAHKIKGLLANLSALRAHHYAEKLEIAAKNKDTEKLADVIPTLVAHFKEFYQLMIQEQKRMKSVISDKQKATTSGLQPSQTTENNTSELNDLEGKSGELTKLLYLLKQQLWNFEPIELKEIDTITQLLTQDGKKLISTLESKIIEHDNEGAMIALQLLARTQEISLDQRNR